MRYLVWKSRISLLWGAVAVLTTLHMLLVVAEPGAIDDLRAGKIMGMDTTGPVTIMWVLFVLIPLLMAVLTFVVPDGPNRWANGVVGVVLAGVWVPDFAEHQMPGAPLLTAAVVVAGLLIAWHAWKWPVQRPVEAERERVPIGSRSGHP
jgi:hypothetical protein